jgi:transposase-like protein
MSIKNEKPNKGKGGRKATHSDSFKVQVALEYLSGPYSYPQVGKKYGLAEHTVLWFVSWYRKNQNLMIADEPIDVEYGALNPSQIRALEKRVALAEMKVAVLEKVIAIANTEYGTDLKKKAATK